MDRQEKQSPNALYNAVKGMIQCQKGNQTLGAIFIKLEHYYPLGFELFQKKLKLCTGVMKFIINRM